ncbi:MAG: hypothetical protein GTN51_10870, partial [Armatimonadetes bacterium]|nr:hypothetical protein [Armatimonadota bacterium]
MSPLLRELVEVKAEKVYLKVAKGEAFIEGRTANVKATADEQAETLAGRHADYMILAADEASGIPAPVFQPLEGAMTGLMNMAILIGNMTRSSGYFYDSHFTALKNRFVTLHWSSEESELVNKFTLKEEEKTYGRDSNWYRVRRLGEPPIAGEDVLIPYEWVMDAVDREIEQEDKEAALIYGIDVADEMGESKSIICQRRGCKVETLFERQTSDTMALSGWASTFIEEEKPDAVGIDSIGVGAGVFHRLRELGHRVNGIKVSRTPSN